jgi:hypothetical protein
MDANSLPLNRETEFEFIILRAAIFKKGKKKKIFF